MSTSGVLYYETEDGKNFRQIDERKFKEAVEPEKAQIGGSDEMEEEEKRSSNSKLTRNSS